MSVQYASLTAIAIAATMFAAGCAQSASPTAPSATAASVGRAITPSMASSMSAPVVSQLDLVDNHLVSANHQLDLCLSLAHPPSPCYQNSLDFYLKANTALDGVAVSVPPGPPAAPATTALNSIIGHANVTLDLLVQVPPGPPAVPQIIEAAQHTISVATALLANTCNADQCSS